MMRQLLDIVNQAVEVPLRVHFWVRAQCETIEPLVMAQVRENRFYRRHSPCVQRSAAFAVDRLFHAPGELKGRALVFLEECNLPRRRSFRIA